MTKLFAPLHHLEETRDILSLNDLNQMIEEFMKNEFGSVHYWVTAEIARVNEKGGHLYFQLVDSQNGTTNAQMNANMWMSTVGSLRIKLGKEFNDIIKSGNKALMQVRVEFHKVYGLKLIVLDVDPSYSYGEIERLKKETIKKLQQEGIYNNQHVLEIPVISKRIALIGSPGTSGYSDFLNELLNNEVYRNFKIKEFSTSVQGDKAVPEIVAALKEARLYNVDVIVLVRGGGGKMDLNVFNHYEIAKEICLTKIPMITGIGHETDEVVADLVACRKEITPTAAAKFLYIQIGTFSSELRKAFDGVIQKSITMLGGQKDEFNNLNKWLIHFSQQILLEGKTQLKDEGHHIQRRFVDFIRFHQGQLDLLIDKTKTQSINNLRLAKDADLPGIIDRIEVFAHNLIQHDQVKLQGLEELLTALNPERLLSRGYTISTIDDIDVMNQEGELEGKTMKTLTTHSIITSQITDTKKK